MLYAAGCGRVDFDPVGDGPIADAGAYHAAVIASAPVGYWRLDDAVGSLVARDVIGGHDGTYMGGFEHVGGVLADDAAAAFDGASGAVQAPDVFAFTGSQPFSLEAWVNDTDPTQYAHFVTKEPRDTDNTPLDGYAMLTTGGGAFLERVVGAGTTMTSANAPMTAGAWMHLVGVYDGSLLSIYADGALVPGGMTDGRTMPTYATPLYFGRQSMGAFLGGGLDEIAIYDHALSPSEIANHHALGVAGQ